jgi:hypothetical protein
MNEDSPVSSAEQVLGGISAFGASRVSVTWANSLEASTQLRQRLSSYSISVGISIIEMSLRWPS